MDVSDFTLRELGLRCRRYFIKNVIGNILNRYIITLDKLNTHMFRIYGITIVLEDPILLGELIEGAYQIYEKNHHFRDNTEIRPYVCKQPQFRTIQ